MRERQKKTVWTDEDISPVHVCTIVENNINTEAIKHSGNFKSPLLQQFAMVIYA